MEEINTQTESNLVVITDESPEDLQKYTPECPDQIITETLIRTLQKTQRQRKKDIRGVQVIDPLLKPHGVVFQNEGKRCLKRFDDDFLFENTEKFHKQCVENNWEPVFKFNDATFTKLANGFGRENPTYYLLNRFFNEKIDKSTTFFILSTRLLKEMALKTARVHKGWLGSETKSLIAFLVETIFNQYKYKPRRKKEKVKTVKHTATQRANALRNVSALSQSSSSDRWAFDPDLRCLPMLQSDYVVDEKKHEVVSNIPKNCQPYFSTPVEDLVYKPSIKMLLKKEKEEQKRVWTEKCSNLMQTWSKCGTIMDGASINTVLNGHDDKWSYEQKDEEEAAVVTTTTTTTSNTVQTELNQLETSHSLGANPLSTTDEDFQSMEFDQMFPTDSNTADTFNFDDGLSLADVTSNDVDRTASFTLLDDETTSKELRNETTSNLSLGGKQALIDQMNAQRNAQHEDTTDFSAAIDHDADGAAISSSKSVSNGEKAEKVKPVVNKKKRKRKKTLPPPRKPSQRKRKKIQYLRDEQQ